MFRFLILSTAGLAALLALAACSPAFNWREVRPENTRFSLLLPCKPDKAQKVVPLGGQATTLSMLGCDADGVTFAVAVADVGPGRASCLRSRFRARPLVCRSPVYRRWDNAPTAQP